DPGRGAVEELAREHLLPPGARRLRAALAERGRACDRASDRRRRQTPRPARGAAGAAAGPGGLLILLPRRSGRDRVRARVLRARPDPRPAALPRPDRGARDLSVAARAAAGRQG